MNLEQQKITGTNEVHVIDSLNASLLEVNIKNNENTVIPDSEDLFIYVDKASSSTPTKERKQYLFNLNSSLKSLGEVSDEFELKIVIENNDVVMRAYVKRMIGVSEEGNYLLEIPVIEDLEGYPLTLFEGENYIYTNYLNASIEVIYPKDNDFNRMFLNNASYYHHKLRNDGEFCLDDIYFKDAFTKTEDKLNLEVDHANVCCLTSKNNKFSLDEDGNLIVNSIIMNNQPENVVGEVILESESSTLNVDNLDAINEGGVYEFLVIGYTNSTTSTDMQIKINNQTKGYHHSYINASGTLSATGSLTSRSNYAQSVNDINEYLQTNGPNNTFPVIIEGRMYISENSSGNKKVNYTYRHYRTVAGGQSIVIGGGVFSQNFENINSISIALANSSIQFAKGSRLTVFNPLRGARGPKGEKGETGEAGLSNTLTIGTVTSGDVASATITGESPNQVLNLVLPKGDAGENGGTLTESDIQNIIDEKISSIYPVGSIYMSVVETNPAVFFGGTWEQLKDKFLLGAGDSYVAGITGGSSELQEHSHSIPSLSGTALSNGNHTHTLGADLDVTYTTKSPGSFSMHNSSPSDAGYSFSTGSQGAHTHSVTTNASNTGNAGTGNEGNMPPYLSVYMWKRVS